MAHFMGKRSHFYNLPATLHKDLHKDKDVRRVIITLVNLKFY